MAPIEDPLLKVSDVLEILNVSRNTFDKWCQVNKGPRACRLLTGSLRFRTSAGSFKLDQLSQRPSLIVADQRSIIGASALTQTPVPHAAQGVRKPRSSIRSHMVRERTRIFSSRELPYCMVKKTRDVSPPRRTGLVLICLSTVVVIVLVLLSGKAWAERIVALATVLLASATVWLGLQTRAAVKVGADELEQNRKLLALTTEQAASAEKSADAATLQVELTSRTLALSNQPFVSLRPDHRIMLQFRDDSWVVSVPVYNYGSSAAIVETNKDRFPRLKFSREGYFEITGQPGFIVIPRDTETSFLFERRKSHPDRNGPPEVNADGQWNVATLEYWVTDSSKETHYQIIATFHLQDDNSPPTVAEFILDDITIGGPTKFASGNGVMSFSAHASAAVTQANIPADDSSSSPPI